MSKSAENIMFQTLRNVMIALGKTKTTEIQNRSQEFFFFFLEGSLWFKGGLGGFNVLRSSGTGLRETNHLPRKGECLL